MTTPQQVLRAYLDSRGVDYSNRNPDEPHGTRDGVPAWDAALHRAALRAEEGDHVMISQDAMRRRMRGKTGPKTGDDLFEGTSYPRSWDEYVGQEEAVEYIRAACFSAKMRGTRLDHTLIATGAHGIGKTAIAKLIAAEMDAGLVEVQGAVDEREAVRIFAGMSDGDILLWDEIHQAVAKGRAKAEWLLPVLQDGVMITSKGVQPIPDVTIIGATTDVQKLPETIISRFTVKPVMEAYTTEQAVAIAKVTAAKIFDHPTLVAPNEQTCSVVARAGNNNPRQISQLLKTLRDSALGGKAIVTESGNYSLDTMFRWSGVTPDGLDKLAQDYLQVLYGLFGGKAGEKAIAAALGEPTPPRHTEKMLVEKGFVLITPGGRELTPEGNERAIEVAVDRGYQEA